MTNAILKNTIQATLNNIINIIDKETNEFNIEVWKKSKSKFSSNKIAEVLGITVPMLNEFEETIKQYFSNQENIEKERISCLRISLWLETISKNLNILFAFDLALTTEETAVKQVRALELIIRDVITEQLGGTDNVIVKLQNLFKQDVIDKWIKSADNSGILSGTTFSELSNILLDKNIFQGIEEIFKSSNIELTKSTRDSLRYILEDIRIIRNSIAHNKKVSNIQIEALNVYYQTISTIIKNAQRTKIDPDSYLDLTKLNMEEFISTIKQDNQIISGNIDAIKQNVEQILTDTKDIKNQLKTNWVSKKFLILYSVILLLIISLIIIFNSYSNRIINTKIQFLWVSENASYPFNELGKVTLLTDKYKNDYYINSNGLVELTNIPSENLDSKINLEFNNDNIYQIDTPNLERNMIHSIKLSVKNLNKIQFIIRDYNTGNPVDNATINFNGYALNTDIFGKASQVVSQDKQRKYIDIEVICKGYKFYKLTDIMVDANKPIEILLEK
jgi:hypothetical protein